MTRNKPVDKASQRGKPKIPGTRRKAKTEMQGPVQPARPAQTDILDRINDGIVAFDAGMNYIYVNQKGGELLGRNPKDLVGKNYWAEYPEARGTTFANAYLRALETQEMIVIEDYYAPFQRWFENRIYPSKEGLTIFFTDITDRKGTEMRLRESRERLALAIRSANVGLWDWDLRANKVHYSTEWKGQLGYEDREISDDFSEWESRVHPDDLERAKATVSGYIERHYPNFQNEFRMRHKDGSYRWILAQASLMTDEWGTPVRMLGSHIDLTQRKRAEDELRRERDFSEAALDSLPGVFYMYDEDRKFLRWNRNFEQVTGYTGAEIAAMNPLDFFEGEEKELLAERIREVFERGESSVEANFVAKDGARTSYFFTGRVVQVEGKPCLIGVGIDITERKRAEEELRAAQQLFYKTFHVSPIASTLATFPERKALDINAAFELMFGYTRAEIIGHSLADFDFWADPSERQRAFEIASRAGGLHDFEFQFKKKSGKFGYALMNTEIIEEGGAKYLLTKLMNITERKRAEEEIRLNRDRLAELSRRLVQTHETESRAIGRELHDQIGQMLTALKLTLEIAPQLPPEPAAKKFAQAHELVDDLLNRVSRLSLELRPPMLDDLGLIPALLWHVNRYREGTGIQVDFKHSEVEGKRFSSEIETTAYRIVQESLTNVARHARATRARFEVRQRDGWLEIEIEDDGVGFDPESALAKNRGLSGMRERAGLVGGTFQIDSQKGKGTRKIVRLPLQEEIA